jgi:hypothetical protein
LDRLLTSESFAFSGKILVGRINAGERGFTCGAQPAVNRSHAFFGLHAQRSEDVAAAQGRKGAVPAARLMTVRSLISDIRIEGCGQIRRTAADGSFWDVATTGQTRLLVGLKKPPLGLPKRTKSATQEGRTTRDPAMAGYGILRRSQSDETSRFYLLHQVYSAAAA